MRGEFCKSSSFHLCLDISFVLSGCSREAAGGKREEKRECVSVYVYSSELVERLKLGNVWVFVQLIHRPMRAKNQPFKNPNIA